MKHIGEKERKLRFYKHDQSIKSYRILSKQIRSIKDLNEKLASMNTTLDALVNNAPTSNVIEVIESSAYQHHSPKSQLGHNSADDFEIVYSKESSHNVTG